MLLSSLMLIDGGGDIMPVDTGTTDTSTSTGFTPMTETQWNSIQNNLLPEDRGTYADYLGMTTPIDDPQNNVSPDEFLYGGVQRGEYYGEPYIPVEPPPPTDPYQPPVNPFFPPFFPFFQTLPPNFPPFFTPSPPDPPPPPPPPPPPSIKIGTPQYVLFNDDEVPVDAIVDLLFENVGGHELLNIARHDTVQGQKILYNPIKNLNILKEEYNPNNLVRLQQTSDKFFANYTIKLSDKIPIVGNGVNGDNVYLDTNGNLVIEFINIFNDENIEVQITTNGTIYEAGI